MVVGLSVVGRELQTRPLGEEVHPKCLKACKGLLDQPYPSEVITLPPGSRHAVAMLSSQLPFCLNSAPANHKCFSMYILNVRIELNTTQLQPLYSKDPWLLIDAKDAGMMVNFVFIHSFIHLDIRDVPFKRVEKSQQPAVRAGRESLNTVVELPVLLEKVPSGQATCSEQTKRHGSPELGLDTPARCRTKQGDTAPQRKL